MNPGWQPTFDLPESTTLSLPGRGTTELWDSGEPERVTTSASTPSSAFSFGKEPSTFDLDDTGVANEEPPAATSLPVLLLHGWNIDARTNYGFAFAHLAQSHRVVMYDQHGHGNGPRHGGVFSLEDAANDAITILDALDIPRAIILGYSLGGAVAQTLAHNHRERCAGLVLSATSGRFSQTRREAAEFFILARTARVLRRIPPAARSAAFTAILSIATKKYPEWIANVVRNGDPISLLEAGASLGTFDSSTWNDLSTIPSSFVITSNDVIVPKRRQVDLATQLDVASLHSIAAGHEVPILNDNAFSSALAAAIGEVVDETRVAH